MPAQRGEIYRPLRRRRQPRNYDYKLSINAVMAADQGDGKRRGEEGMATKKATRLSDGLSYALAHRALTTEARLIISTTRSQSASLICVKTTARPALAQTAKPPGCTSGFALSPPYNAGLGHSGGVGHWSDPPSVGPRQVYAQHSRA